MNEFELVGKNSKEWSFKFMARLYAWYKRQKGFKTKILHIQELNDPYDDMLNGLEDWYIVYYSKER